MQNRKHGPVRGSGCKCVFDTLERRRLWSSTIYTFGLDGNSSNAGSMSMTHSGGTEHTPQYPGDIHYIDFTNSSVTFTISGLPAHAMLRVPSVPQVQMWPDYDNDEDKFSIQVGSHTWTQTQTGYYDENGAHMSSTYTGGHSGVWLADSGTSISVTYKTEELDPDYGTDYTKANGLSLELYLPTVTISGSAPVREDSDFPFTFTVNRDTPDGYNGDFYGDDAIPDTTVSLSASGTATPTADYTPNLPTSVTISGGATSKTINLMPVLDDLYHEQTETVIASIVANPSQYNVGNPSQATDEITNAELTISLDKGSVSVKNDGSADGIQYVTAHVMVGSKPKGGIKVSDDLISAGGQFPPTITFPDGDASDYTGKVIICVSGQFSLGGCSPGLYHYKIFADGDAFALLDVTVTN